MPRERFTTTDPDAPFDLMVSWERDGNLVQVNTTAYDADQRLRDWVEVDPATGEGTSPGTRFTLFNGWHVGLDRPGINRVIRTLRIARDQAFGRDE